MVPADWVLSAVQQYWLSSSVLLEVNHLQPFVCSIFSELHFFFPWMQRYILTVQGVIRTLQADLSHYPTVFWHIDLSHDPAVFCYTELLHYPIVFCYTELFHYPTVFWHTELFHYPSRYIVSHLWLHCLFQYTALLRLPESMPTKDKKKRVYEIIDDLDMRKCLNTSRFLY